MNSISDLVVAFFYLEVDIRWLVCIQVGCVVCICDVIVVLILDVIPIVGVDGVIDVIDGRVVDYLVILSAEDVELDEGVNLEVRVVE